MTEKNSAAPDFEAIYMDIPLDDEKGDDNVFMLLGRADLNSSQDEDLRKIDEAAASLTDKKISDLKEKHSLNCDIKKIKEIIKRKVVAFKLEVLSALVAPGESASFQKAFVSELEKIFKRNIRNIFEKVWINNEDWISLAEKFKEIYSQKEEIARLKKEKLQLDKSGWQNLLNNSQRGTFVSHEIKEEKKEELEKLSEELSWKIEAIIHETKELYLFRKNDLSEASDTLLRNAKMRIHNAESCLSNIQRTLERNKKYFEKEIEKVTDYDLANKAAEIKRTTINVATVKLGIGAATKKLAELEKDFENFVSELKK